MFAPDTNAGCPGVYSYILPLTSARFYTMQFVFVPHAELQTSFHMDTYLLHLNKEYYVRIEKDKKYKGQ